MYSTRQHFCNNDALINPNIITQHAWNMFCIFTCHDKLNCSPDHVIILYLFVFVLCRYPVKLKHAHILETFKIFYVVATDLPDRNVVLRGLSQAVMAQI